MTSKNQRLGRVLEFTIANLVTGKQIKRSLLRGTIKATKTDTVDGNKAKIRIYNLSQSSRELIQTENDKSGRPQTAIEVRAGYKGQELGLIWRGKGEVVSTYKAPDWVTEILCTDGVQELKSKPINFSYPAGTSIENIVKDLFKITNIKDVITVGSGKVLPKDRSFSSDASKFVKDLEESFGVKIDIQDEQGIITNENNTGPNSSSRFLLSRYTGLLNSPRKKGDIVIAEALIDHNLKPSNFVELESIVSPGLNGVYKIRKVDLNGDNWGGPWFVVMEMQLTGFLPSYQSLTGIEGVLA